MAIFGTQILTSMLVLIIIILLLALVQLYNRVSCGYYKGTEKMTGKTVIITGANGGIGKETAKEIAKRGGRVIMACRNIKAGEEVRDEIIKTTQNGNVILKKLDLSSQKSIREFAEDITSTEPKLDVLIHNAAVGETIFRKTEDVLEINMATNYFGPFLLTHLLIDLLKKSAPSRIVLVSSAWYRVAALDLNNINPSSAWCPGYYYYVSKYAINCSTVELARRLRGTGVTANCLHPGVVGTDIFRHLPYPVNIMYKWLLGTLFKSPTQGCQTTLYVACSRELEGVTGKYFSECTESSVGKGARDEEKAKELWRLSQKFANLRSTDPKI